jgi:hypothetical protein
MSGFPEQLTNPAQANGPVIVNANLAALGGAVGIYAYRVNTSTGLVLGYFGGHIAGSSIADGTTTLAASEANVYVVAHRTTGAVTSATNTTNWNATGTYGRLYHAVTGASTITTLTDWRSQLGGIFDHGAVSGSISTDTIWDAAGDLAVGTGADAAARLAKGTALQVLRVNAGATALEWATPAGGDADDITYTPTTLADWDGSADPGDVEQALDQLAERVTDVEGAAVDAAVVTYTPTTVADWDGAADPGNLDDALDQLAERVTDLEGAGGGSTQGRHAVYIAAGSMRPSVAGGCAALAAIASAANQPDIVSLNFDATTQEYAQCSITMPKSWDEGTVTFAPLWSHASTTTNFGVVFDLQGYAASNDDAIATAFGTAQTSTDTGGTTDDIYMGPESSAITIAGTPAAEDTVFFRLSRVTGNGSDTMAIDARLHGIVLYITTNADTDA